MLVGEYEHSVDVKGRIKIPAKFREKLGEKIWITKGLDECLFVYSNDEWNTLQAKLDQLLLVDPNSRGITRGFLGGAIECEFDKQGRVLITANLRKFAGIEKDVIVIGVSKRAEIWSKDRWEAYSNDEDLSLNAVAEKMAAHGIML